MTQYQDVAYFSMEIALDPAMPTYSGGLGVLAGDTLRSAADLSLSMVAVSLLHRRGYFYQRLDAEGRQFEEPVDWVVSDFLREMPDRVEVTIEGRPVAIRAWRYDLTGASGFVVPVYLLDTDLPENSDGDRKLTHSLYGGDEHYRLCQEIVLGIGGIRMLRAAGCDRLRKYHMNEGHAALLTLELLDEEVKRTDADRPTMDHVRAVHDRCVFTTHTPVEAGHDQFPMELVARVLGRRDVYDMHDVFCCDGVLNMTFLAMNLSHFINGVAKRHGEVTQQRFGRYQIDSITNGVHAATWASPAFQKLFDDHFPSWRGDNYSLRYALGISPEKVWDAHQQEKHRLIELVNRQSNAGMDVDVFAIGFARRATAYKRPDLLFHDIERLKRIADQIGPFQIVFAGKAHPRDEEGKQLIRRVFEAKQKLYPAVRVAWLPNYDIRLAQILTAGCDLWLNTPKPPMEASGTSGMKAALNGVPSLSVPDGWWLEGCIEGITGWSIGEDARIPELRQDGVKDAASLYEKLETEVLPMFLTHRDRYVDIMRHCIALNGSFFNTQRMMQQYVQKAYF
ncbi:MAG: alpha-glucan family phosphorylase [Planctomycetaceae bacterium]